MKFVRKKIIFNFLLVFFGLLFCSANAGADPTRYPQYAQQHLPQGVTPEFIYLNQLVDDIMKRKRPIIIDVRSAKEYQEAHIKASVSIPLSEFHQFEKLPKDRLLVLY